MRSSSLIIRLFLLMSGLGILVATFTTLFLLRPWETSSDAHELTDTTESITERDTFIHPRIKDLALWKRPEGPVKVALQVGHWQAENAPNEQDGLRKSTGTSYGSITEWETMLTITEKTKTLLEEEGYLVELLPVTIPPNYWADVFVSLHADGNEDRSKSGYKIAAPRFDYGKKGDTLARIMNEEYGKLIPLTFDDEITPQMRGYYAFNWFRYDHSIHPLVPASIVEAGFLTNAKDRQILTRRPDLVAQGITNGIIRFIEEENIGK